MKKYLIMLAAVLVLFASCDKKSKYTSIRFKSTEITIAQGGTAKLQVLYEPADLAAPECTWASSNTAVATVDETGGVTGVAVGTANITAKTGDLETVCKVTVVDPYEVIEWGGWALFDLDKETILSKDTVLRTLSTGQQVKCVMIPATYYVWDTDITINAEGSLEGAGALIQAEGTALLITDALDAKGPNFYYLGYPYLSFVDPAKYNPTDTTYAYCCPAGKITGTAEQHLAWLEDESGTAPAAFTGNYLNIVDFDAQKYLSLFAGLAGGGVFAGDETYTQYKFYASWFQGNDQAYGLVFVQNEEEKWEPKQPAEWAPLKEYYYENLEAPEAPKYTAKEFVAPKQDVRKFARPTDVMSHK